MSKKLPLVSILINNYNYKKFVGESIESALAQTYPNIEVVVVDDGSTDGSPEILKNFSSRVKLILKENGGQASAFNAGFASSTGDIICFLDADDVYAPTKVQEIVNQFTLSEETGWCYDKVVLCDEALKPLETAPLQTIAYPCDLRENLKEGKLKDHLPFVIPPTSGLSFKREIIEKIFPLYESESCSMCENYMKYVAVGLSKGVCLDTGLTLQRIHGSNLFTRAGTDHGMTARISILTGYWILKKFPEFVKFADTQIAVAKTHLKISTVPEKYHVFLKEYLGSRDVISLAKIHLRYLYYFYVRKITRPSSV